MVANTFYDACPTCTGSSGMEYRIDYIEIDSRTWPRVTKSIAHNYIGLCTATADDKCSISDLLKDLPSGSGGGARLYLNQPASIPKLYPESVDDPRVPSINLCVISDGRHLKRI